MPCSWGGNRISVFALAMRHQLQWSIHLLAHGLRKRDEHPAYTLLMGSGTPFMGFPWDSHSHWNWESHSRGHLMRTVTKRRTRKQRHWSLATRAVRRNNEDLISLAPPRTFYDHFSVASRREPGGMARTRTPAASHSPTAGTQNSRIYHG